MKKQLLQDIRSIANQDFAEITSSINAKNKSIQASLKDVLIRRDGSRVVATGCFQMKGQNDIIEADIHYWTEKNQIFADIETSSVADAVLGVSNSNHATILAADDDEPNDAFNFDDEPGDNNFGLDEDDESEFDSDIEDPENTEIQMEDPEEEPHVAADNNISGHYIVECDRCQGVFISALTESDQVVENIHGVCPLCQKESDQYVKWVVKPVEFN